MAAQLEAHSEILVYMTQDAVLSGAESLTNLVAVFDDPRVAAAYGRQLPRPGAGAAEVHAVRFDYPAESTIRDLASQERWGLKTVFLSNVFAAYRRSALMAVGGFPVQAILGEDTMTAGALLLAGYNIAYVAEACVYRSRSYTWRQDFRRSFDIGVLHHRERWLLDGFGHAGGEAWRFVLSELNYLRERDILRVPSALLRSGLKLLGYRLGRMEDRLTLEVKRKLSQHPEFWEDEA